jgi:hypothetical protein
MPDTIHPNFNWLRGSRWGWEDGHVSMGADPSMDLLGSDLDGLAAAAAVRVGVGGEAGWVRYATLRDDGMVLTAASDGAQFSHFSQLLTFLLSLSLSSLSHVSQLP